MIREGQQAENNTSRRQKIRVINQSREEGHTCLFNDYSSANLVHADDQFHRRFKIRRHAFLRIVEAHRNHDDYFQTRVDAVRRLGLSPLQKCIVTLRLLAYGVPADGVDDCVWSV